MHEKSSCSFFSNPYINRFIVFNQRPKISNFEASILNLSLHSWCSILQAFSCVKMKKIKKFIETNEEEEEEEKKGYSCKERYI